jgi:hypothetical protein
MYFRHENGSYKRVPQYPNAQLGYEGCVSPTLFELALLTSLTRQNDTSIKGGMTIYYTEKDFVSDGDEYITGFAPVIYKPVQEVHRDAG